MSTISRSDHYTHAIHASYLSPPPLPCNSTKQHYPAVQGTAWTIWTHQGTRTPFTLGFGKYSSPTALLIITNRQREREREEKIYSHKLWLVWLLNVRKEQFDSAAMRGKVSVGNTSPAWSLLLPVPGWQDSHSLHFLTSVLFNCLVKTFGFFHHLWQWDFNIYWK